MLITPWLTSIPSPAVGEYRRAMNEFASWQTLQVWYAYLQVERVQAELRRIVDPNTARRAEKA